MPSASTTGNPDNEAAIRGSKELLPPISLEMRAVAFLPVNSSMALNALKDCKSLTFSIPTVGAPMPPTQII